MSAHTTEVAEVEVRCRRCGRVEVCPAVGQGVVDITALTGWVAPPMLCPGCAADRRTDVPFNWSDRPDAWREHLRGCDSCARYFADPTP